jgi:hypothetical protein
MIQDQLIEEIKLIPEDRLAEMYNLIHLFRLGLKQESTVKPINLEHPIGLAKGSFQVPASFFEQLPTDLLDAFEGH